MHKPNLTPEQLKEESLRWSALKTEIAHTIVGQQHIIDRVTIGLIAGGHILLEGVPGLAKTTLIKAFSEAVGLSFSRIQFTPDLLPADIIGTLVYNPKTQDFETRKGPIFTNILLADEINRAPAKVQSALLEAMQEYQVTLGQESHQIQQPFLVLATQNPIDQEGTYHLPEAQVDRFLFKLVLDYPTREEELLIVEKSANITEQQRKPQAVITTSDIQNGRNALNDIYVDPKVTNYILDIITTTRKPTDKCKELAPLIRFGASPRGSLALHLAARAHAFLHQRHFVIPDDVKAVAGDALRHRLLLSYEAEIDHVSADDVIARALEIIPSP